jgi:hypothetical protein
MTELRSRVVTKGSGRTIHRLQLRAGIDEAAMARPFVGVAHPYGEVSPRLQSLKP